MTAAKLTRRAALRGLAAAGLAAPFVWRAHAAAPERDALPRQLRRLRHGRGPTSAR